MNVEPLREAMLGLARADAERIAAEAEARASAALAEAGTWADELVARARAEAEAAAAAETASELRRARDEGRTRVLRARRAVYDELRREAHAAALALRGDPDYPELLERLAAAARRTLGEDAEVLLDPPGVGGVVARAGGRRVDLTLPTLVERCLSSLGPELEGLWG
jgi:vacuolar-type H+-ATPase subunit E/Vma4